MVAQRRCAGKRWRDDSTGNDSHKTTACRRNGTPAQWNAGAMERRRNGTPAQWNAGAMERRRNGTPAQWNAGAMERRRAFMRAGLATAHLRE
jgi:hypothetical protein